MKRSNGWKRLSRDGDAAVIFALSEGNRRARVSWEVPPGIYLIAAEQDGHVVENVAISLGEAMDKGETFVRTGLAPDWAPEGHFEATLRRVLRRAGDIRGMHGVSRKPWAGQKLQFSCSVGGL